MSHHKEEKYFGGWILTAIIIAICVVLLAVTIIPPVVSSVSQSDDEIVIGALLPLTGVNSNRGLATQEGINLALEDARNKGYNIRVEYRDTESNEDTALYRYFELIDQGIVAFIGPTDSAETDAIAPYAELFKTPLLTFGTSTKLASYKNYIYKFSPSDKNLSSKIISEILADSIDSYPDKEIDVAVVWAQNSFARSFYENIVKYANSGHDETKHVANIISVPITSIDEAVQKLSESDPVMVLIIPENPTQLSNLLTELYNKDVCQDVWLFSTDSGYGDEILENPAAYGLSIISPKIQSTGIFEDKFEEKYGKAADNFNAQGYDAFKALTDVIYNNNYDEKSITEGFKNYRDNGITGPIYFNQEDLTRYPIYQVHTAYLGNWYEQDIYNYLHGKDKETDEGQLELVKKLRTAAME